MKTESEIVESAHVQGSVIAALVCCLPSFLRQYPTETTLS